jgi:hypothetical protein
MPNLYCFCVCDVQERILHKMTKNHEKTTKPSTRVEDGQLVKAVILKSQHWTLKNLTLSRSVLGSHLWKSAKSALELSILYTIGPW